MEKTEYYCSKCGSPLSENDDLCPNCGTNAPWFEDYKHVNTIDGNRFINRNLEGRLTDEQLVYDLETNALLWRTLFRIAGLLQAIYGFICIFYLIYLLAEGLVETSSFSRPIEIIFLSFIWFAIGNIFYYRSLASARLIEQGSILK